MSNVNKDEAPEGYYAVGSRGFTCYGCDFRAPNGFECHRPGKPSCIADDRYDNCHVHFKRKGDGISGEEAK